MSVARKIKICPAIVRVATFLLLLVQVQNWKRRKLVRVIDGSFGRIS